MSVIPPFLVAILSVSSLCVLIVYFMIKRLPPDKESEGRGWSRRRLGIALTVAVVAIIGLSAGIARDPLVTFFTPKSVVVSTENNYITLHKLSFQDDSSPYGLVVEFGVNFHDADLDAHLILSGDYKILSEFWDKPGLEKPSADASALTGAVRIKDASSLQVLGSAQVIEHFVTPPDYVVATRAITLVPSTRSFYVVFQSQAELSIKAASVGGKIVVPKGVR